MLGDADEIPKRPKRIRLAAYLSVVGPAFSRGTNTIEERVHSDFELLRP
jgi:hypothetical protein